MTAGNDGGTGGGPDQRTLQSGRAWQHPSEVGLATRGRADRRRSTLIASAVVAGAVALLLSGLLMGTMQESASATSSTLPVERAHRSIALVKVGPDGATATGLVLDDEGHVLVDAGPLSGAGEVWVRCADGHLQHASVMGSDDRTDLAVLELDRPRGTPASIARSVPGPGTDLLLVRAGDATDTSASMSVRDPSDGGVGQLVDLATARAPERFLATFHDAQQADSPQSGAMVFDRSGRLVGVADGSGVTVRVLSAAEAVRVADELIARRP